MTKLMMLIIVIGFYSNITPNLLGIETSQKINTIKIII
jgi:hypothetical protein